MDPIPSQDNAGLEPNEGYYQLATVIVALSIVNTRELYRDQLPQLPA